jgi:hypothetical protein
MEPVPNNYPDQFSEEEQQMLDTISERRKKYLAKYGSAEHSFLTNPESVREHNATVTGKSESQIANNLFK